MQFTSLHFFRSNPEIPVDPATQIREYMLAINVSAKNWFIVAPTPGVREVWFEAEEAVAKPEQLKGYQRTMREMATETKLPTRKTKE